MAVSILFRRTACSHDPHRRARGNRRANLVSDSISLSIYVRTLHGRKASNASQASNASSRINLDIRRAKVCTC